MDFSRMAREGYEAWRRESPEVIAFDTETTGVDFYDEPFCVTVAWGSERGIESHYFELSPDDSHASRGRIIDILLSTPTLVGHNIKFDLQKCILAGLIGRDHLSPGRIEDTELLAHLLDEHRRKGLKVLAEVVLGETTDELVAIKAAKQAVKKEHGFRSESDIGYHLLPREVIVPYALKDAEFTYRLWETLRSQLHMHDDLCRLYQQERGLTLVLLDMEAAGMAVDAEYAQDAAKDYGRRILEQELAIEQLVGLPIGPNVKKGEFNPNSPQQLLAWFSEHGVTLKSTDKDALAEVDHPLAQALLEMRSLTKMHGTYLLPIMAEQRNGVIHPNFRQNVRTGRMASGGATR